MCDTGLLIVCYQAEANLIRASTSRL
jgi:hypothetical protein